MLKKGKGGGGNEDMLVKVYKPPVIRLVSSGDLTYSTRTTVDNIVLYTRKLLREYILSVLTEKQKQKRNSDYVG